MNDVTDATVKELLEAQREAVRNLWRSKALKDREHYFLIALVDKVAAALARKPQDEIGAAIERLREKARYAARADNAAVEREAFKPQDFQSWKDADLISTALARNLADKISGYAKVRLCALPDGTPSYTDYLVSEYDRHLIVKALYAAALARKLVGEEEIAEIIRTYLGHWMPPPNVKACASAIVTRARGASSSGGFSHDAAPNNITREARSGCVAHAYGGPWCTGRCIDPRDCSAKPDNITVIATDDR